MSTLSIVAIVAKKKAFEMFRKQEHFRPDNVYLVESGLYMMSWDWVDWTDFGQEAAQMKEMERVMSTLDKNPEDGCGYKSVVVNEYGGEASRGNLDYEIQFALKLDVPHGAFLLDKSDLDKDINTKIYYLYRDACNFKMSNEVIVSGVFTEAEKQEIVNECCNDCEYFIPSQVGLPENRPDDFPTEDDHCWFELDVNGFTETTELPTVGITAKELLESFRSAKDNWNDTGIFW